MNKSVCVGGISTQILVPPTSTENQLLLLTTMWEHPDSTDVVRPNGQQFLWKSKFP